MEDPDRALRRAADRLVTVQQHIADGHWAPTADTFEIVLRHTIGILRALQSAVVVTAQPAASS